MMKRHPEVLVAPTVIFLALVALVAVVLLALLRLDRFLSHDIMILYYDSRILPPSWSAMIPGMIPLGVTTPMLRRVFALFSGPPPTK